MTTEPRGRGRRNNGLDAVLWSPVRDVDPRVGEHLLDVLQAAGIAAYLEPSADVGPYTRTVFLPSPPSDRLFVDRARRAEARDLLDQHGGDAGMRSEDRPRPGGAVPARSLRSDLDEDAEWAAIVAAFDADHGRRTVDPLPSDALPSDALPSDVLPSNVLPSNVLPSDVPPPPPHEPAILDRPDEHYEPPLPPPLPVPAPASLYAVLLVVAGILLIGAPGVLGLSADLGLVLGVAAAGGGVAMLVTRMRERSTDDGDDGAVV